MLDSRSGLGLPDSYVFRLSRLVLALMLARLRMTAASVYREVSPALMHQIVSSRCSYCSVVWLSDDLQALQNPIAALSSRVKDSCGIITFGVESGLCLIKRKKAEAEG